MAKNKNPGPLLTTAQLGGEAPIPPEFVAAMQRLELVQKEPTDIGPEALSGLIIESRVEQTETAERKRITVKKVAGNIVLLWYNTNQQGQPVQVTRTMRPTGAPLVLPTATTALGVKDLGNGWSIEESSVEGTFDGSGNFVPGVFGGNLYAKERPNLFPQEFRPAIPVVTTRVDSAGTAIAPTLSGDELSESQEQLDPYKKRITIETQADPSVPVVLDTGRDTNDVKQDVIVTKTLLADATAATTATALKDVAVTQLGNGFKVQTTREVSEVFPGSTFSKERPNLVPEEFRPAIPTVTTASVTTGTAGAPTLGATELSQTQQQVDEFNKKTTSVTQAAPSLPVTLDKGRDTNSVKQDVTVTRKLMTDGTTADTATALKDVKVTQLGGGNKVQETREVTTVFAGGTFSRERPNLVPEEFRPSIPTVTSETTTTGTAVDPTLSGTELAESQTQVDEFNVRTKITTQAAPSLPITLDKGRDTNAAKQDVTVTRKLLADGTAAETATALKDVKVTQLGDGNKVQETRVVSALFSGTTYSRERPDVTPNEFAAQLTKATVQVDSTGVAADPSLGAGDVSQTQQQIDEFNKRTTTTTRDQAVLPVSVTGLDTNQWKQAVGVVKTLMDVGDATASPDALTDVDVTELGDGTKVETVRTIAGVLPLNSYTVRAESLLPSVFLVGAQETITEATTVGAAAAPSLSGDEVERVDQQLNATDHRLTIRTRGTVADATSFTGKEHVSGFGGAIVSHVISKEASNALTVDFRTVLAKSEALGDGKFLVEYKKLPSGAWPALIGYEWDEFARRHVKITKQVVATGTTTQGLTSGVLTEVKEIDDLHELSIISEYTSLPSTQTLPVSIDLSTPNWFTSGPTQIDANSGYTADRGESYAVQNKTGRYAAVLVRTFSLTAPSAPGGTYLNFEPESSRTAEAYNNAGDEPYCRILYYDVPSHIAAEPSGAYLVGVQSQIHRMLYVLETITVTL